MYKRYSTGFLLKNNNKHLYNLLNYMYDKEANIIYSNIYQFRNFLSINMEVDIPDKMILNKKYKNYIESGISTEFKY